MQLLRHEMGAGGWTGAIVQVAGWNVSVVGSRYLDGKVAMAAVASSMRSTLTRASHNLWTLCVSVCVDELCNRAGEWRLWRQCLTIVWHHPASVNSPGGRVNATALWLWLWWCHVKRPLSHNVAPRSMPGEFSLFLCCHFRFLLLLLLLPLPFRLLVTARSKCATSCKN